MTDQSDDDPTRTILRAAGDFDRAAPVGDVLLAAWAEGRLDPERAALVEAYLAANAEVRALAFALREEHLEAARVARTADAGPPGGTGPASSTIPSLAAARARRVTWLPFGVAAAALLALGVGFLASRPRSPASLDSDARLVAAAENLAQVEPDLFRDFRPIGAVERRDAVGDTTRAGLTILEPVGHVVGPRSAFRWTSARGGASYEVVVADADGAAIWCTTTDRASVAADGGPVLAAGKSYVVEVSATGPLGRTTASRRFDLADPAAADALETARAAARRVLGEDLGDLAYAHLCARRGYLTEAMAGVAGYLAHQPKDAGARDFEDYLRRRLGWPEAGNVDASRK